METAPRNCRFLSLVVVERVLILVDVITFYIQTSISNCRQFSNIAEENYNFLTPLEIPKNHFMRAVIWKRMVVPMPIFASCRFWCLSADLDHSESRASSGQFQWPAFPSPKTNPQTCREGFRALFATKFAGKIWCHFVLVALSTNTRTVSEYCSARVSCVGLSTKQATEPYSDNLLNRTRKPSEPYSDKEIPLQKSFEAVCFLSRVLNWESTENWDFHRLEPRKKPYPLTRNYYENISLRIIFRNF